MENVLQMRHCRSYSLASLFNLNNNPVTFNKGSPIFYDDKNNNLIVALTELILAWTKSNLAWTKSFLAWTESILSWPKCLDGIIEAITLNRRASRTRSRNRRN